MSSLPTSRSADLARLRAEGYDITIRQGYLVLGGVPYVTEEKRVERAELVTAQEIGPDGRNVRPTDHTILFTGSYPCDAEGRRLEKIVADSNRAAPFDGLIANHRFSQKPSVGYYDDYHMKLTHYANILTAYARMLEPSTTATTLAPVETTEDASVFRYRDTATSRAGIGAIASKLMGLKLAIVGLGGTGSYLLDLVAKTAVREIHLYDGDRFLWHNAFRSPGAPSLDEVAEPPYKVDYYADLYGRFRREIIPHPIPVDASNVDELLAMDFVFLALEDGAARKLIVDALERQGVPFIDVGIGVYEVDGALGGVLRVTTSTPALRAHVHRKNRIPFTASDAGNEYARNIQLAELNALNASLAVIKWKKLFGFYADIEREHHSTYAIDGNSMTNEDHSDDCPNTP